MSPRRRQIAKAVARDAAAAQVPEVQDPELRPPRLLLVPREPRGGRVAAELQVRQGRHLLGGPRQLRIRDGED